MRLFNLFVTILVVAGLIAINLYRNNDIVEWLALAATGLFMMFLFAYNIIYKK